jgi:protein-S-isoprenylcysteine O-methyltransferase Ste14
MKYVNGHKRGRHKKRIDIAGEYKWGDTGQIIILFIFIIGLISDILIFKLSISWQNILPWYLRLVIFISLFIFSGYLAQNGLKKVFKEERKEIIVIDTGVFSIVRHPIYLGSIIVYLSFVVLSLSIVAFFIFLIIFVFYYYLCRYEEKILIKKLGNKYQVYMKNVPMLIPKIWKRKR